MDWLNDKEIQIIQPFVLNFFPPLRNSIFLLCGENKKKNESSERTSVDL